MHAFIIFIQFQLNKNLQDLSEVNLLVYMISIKSLIYVEGRCMFKFDLYKYSNEHIKTKGAKGKS